MTKQSIDILTQLARIGVLSEVMQGLEVKLGGDVVGTQSFKGGLSGVEFTLDAKCPLVSAGAAFLLQAHDWLEEVVVQPHEVVDVVEEVGVLSSVEPIITQESPDQGGIFLFHKAVIVLMVRAAARQLNRWVDVVKEAPQMLIEEFSPVVRVKLAYGERQAGQAVL